MYNVYSISIYFFTALLQATAALMGLSIIFVIYRLQHEYNVYQPYVSKLLTDSNKAVRDDCHNIISHNNEDHQDILKKYIGEEHYYAFEFIISAKARIANIKSSIIPPIIFIALLCMIAAISLWIEIIVPSCGYNIYIIIWSGIYLLLFIIALLDILAAAQISFDKMPIKGFPLSSKIRFKK